MEVYLSGCACTERPRQAITALPSSRREELLCSALKADGFGFVQVSPDPVADMACEAITMALRASGLAPPDVDGVVMCTESFWDVAPPPREGALAYRDFRNGLVAAILSRAGLNNAHPYGLWMAACGNFTSAISLATSLVRAAQHRRVLIVFADRVAPGQSRFMNSGASVLSDMAAAALVSTEGEIEITRAISCPFNGFSDLNPLLQSKAVAEGAARLFDRLAQAGGRALPDYAVLAADSLRKGFYDAICSALRVPQQTFLRPMTADLGHPFSADGLVALMRLQRSLVSTGRDEGLFFNPGPALLGAIEFRVNQH